MIFSSRRSLAIVNLLIFTFIFTILSGVLLIIVSSQTRLMESNIRGVKARYAAEAGIVAAIENIRKSTSPMPVSVEWAFDSATGNPSVLKTNAVAKADGAGIDGTTVVNSTIDYTTNW